MPAAASLKAAMACGLGPSADSFDDSLCARLTPGACARPPTYGSMSRIPGLGVGLMTLGNAPLAWMAPHQGAVLIRAGRGKSKRAGTPSLTEGSCGPSNAVPGFFGDHQEHG